MSINKNENGTLTRLDGQTLVDANPTQNSTRPVSSGGVFTALDGKVSKTGDETIAGVKTFSDGISLGTEYVDISIAGLTLRSDGYTEKDFTSDVPSGYSAYSWRWEGSWDEHLNIMLQHGADNHKICITGSANYQIPSSNRTIRVFIRKFA